MRSFALFERKSSTVRRGSSFLSLELSWLDPLAPKIAPRSATCLGQSSILRCARLRSAECPSWRMLTGQTALLTPLPLAAVPLSTHPSSTLAASRLARNMEHGLFQPFSLESIARTVTTSLSLDKKLSKKPQKSDTVRASAPPSPRASRLLWGPTLSGGTPPSRPGSSGCWWNEEACRLLPPLSPAPPAPHSSSRLMAWGWWQQGRWPTSWWCKETHWRTSVLSSAMSSL
mmetsp:Transcript_49856/g.117205  ORF Transcript_49856/g.117205 Transcript_49856/m.117205 type:complete len:230 (+) Transcript_49856:141-830(+)